MPIIPQHYLSLINPTGYFISLSLQRLFGSACSGKVGGFGPLRAETKGAYALWLNEMKQMNRPRLGISLTFNFIYSSGVACVCRISNASLVNLPTNSDRAEEAWLVCVQSRWSFSHLFPVSIGIFHLVSRYNNHTVGGKLLSPAEPEVCMECVGSRWVRRFRCFQYKQQVELPLPSCL